MSAFHGNFFVRSTDLLALPAVPQDQSYAVEIQIEDVSSCVLQIVYTSDVHLAVIDAFRSVPDRGPAYNLIWYVFRSNIGFCSHVL